MDGQADRRTDSGRTGRRKRADGEMERRTDTYPPGTPVHLVFCLRRQPEVAGGEHAVHGERDDARHRLQSSRLPLAHDHRSVTADDAPLPSSSSLLFCPLLSSSLHLGNGAGVKGMFPFQNLFFSPVIHPSSVYNSLKKLTNFYTPLKCITTWIDLALRFSAQVAYWDATVVLTTIGWLDS